MAKHLFGKKKKPAAADATAVPEGPKVTMLDAAGAAAANPRRKKVPGVPPSNTQVPTILSDRLGA